MIRYALGFLFYLAILFFLPVRNPLIRKVAALCMILPVGFAVIPFSIEFGYDKETSGALVNISMIISFFFCGDWHFCYNDSVMELFEAINKRHSYRSEFSDKAVSKEDLKKIVQAGIQAPSGKNSQTTEFVIITEKSIIKTIAEITGYTYLKTASAIIAVVCDKTPVYFDLTFFREDYSAAVENILLAATSLGYASLWIDGVLRREGRCERISSLLHLPESRLLTVLLPIGVPAKQQQQKEKKSFDERAWFNKYP